MKNFTLRLDDGLSSELQKISKYHALNTDADALRFLIRQESRKIDKEQKMGVLAKTNITERSIDDLMAEMTLIMEELRHREVGKK